MDAEHPDTNKRQRPPDPFSRDGNVNHTYHMHDARNLHVTAENHAHTHDARNLHVTNENHTHTHENHAHVYHLHAHEWHNRHHSELSSSSGYVYPTGINAVPLPTAAVTGTQPPLPSRKRVTEIIHGPAEKQTRQAEASEASRKRPATEDQNTKTKAARTGPSRKRQAPADHVAKAKARTTGPMLAITDAATHPPVRTKAGPAATPVGPRPPPKGAFPKTRGPPSKAATTRPKAATRHIAQPELDQGPRRQYGAVPVTRAKAATLHIAQPGLDQGPRRNNGPLVPGAKSKAIGYTSGLPPPPPKHPPATTRPKAASVHIAYPGLDQ